MANYTFMAVGNPVFDIIETPYVRTDGRVLSGCSVNAALTVGKLGDRAIVVGAVGKDYENHMRDKLEQYGVDVYVFPSRETGGFYLKYLDEKMNDRILRVLGHADKIDISSIPSSIISSSKSVLFGPILDELDIEDVRRFAEAGEHLVIVDPQGFVRERDGDIIRRVPNPRIRRIIEISDVFKPNEHEAAVLFPGRSPVHVAKRIVRIGARIGIVTLAERGSVISVGEEVFWIPAYPTTPRDPTGCGDVYAGAFAYYFLKHDNPIEAAAFASAAASLMVEAIGPDFRLDRKEVERRFEWILENIRRV